MVEKINTKEDGKQTTRLRRWGARVGPYAAAISFGALLFVEPALAQEGASGVCSLPAADSAVPTATLLLRGAVVLVGGYSAVTASQGGGGDGDYGTSGKRVQILGALGVMAVGVLFPELMGFILEQLGSSAADLGLGCAW